MSKDPISQKLTTILESLSDITVTLVADFLGAGVTFGGVPIALRLAELGVTVFPVGVVGEDEVGQQIIHALHEHRISTGGISKVKNYVTPSGGSTELIHGEHPALLNLIENARKFAAASEALYACDCGVGAATPRLLNFIKSNRCLKDKTLAARSRVRITDFEQLTTAIATESEIERAIGLELGGDPKKMAVAGKGVIEELGLESLLVVGSSQVSAFSGSHKPVPIEFGSSTAGEHIDVLGAIFAAALATGAEAADAAQLAVQITGFLVDRQGGKKVRREELISSLSVPKAASRVR
jgi:bifunctional ADP-heptose synthase (sugar kinase/adenylyltransferase)